MQRLKILFFLPSQADTNDIHHELVTRLASELEPLADIDLYTSTHIPNTEKLTSYSLVHVFGCWSTSSVNLLGKAYDHHIPTVYTLLGGLQPWIVNKHKLSRRYALQRKVTQQASAIHLCSKLECDTFAQLAWNQRFTLIMNPVLTNQLSFADMASAMLKLYQKTLDTNAQLLLSQASCQAIGHLLQIGLDKDSLFDERHVKSLRDTLTQLSPNDWRRVMIYANDEHVTDIIKKGLQRIQFPEPNVVVDNIDRFCIARSYPDGDLPNERLCFRGLTTKGRLDDNIKATETNERLLCVQLLNLKHEMENHSAPLLHVANVYTTLRFYDMDEDRLKELVKTLGIEDFAARLMVVLQNVTRLSEGFMPFVPKDDKQRKKMQTKLTKFNTWPSIGNKRS